MLANNPSIAPALTEEDPQGFNGLVIAIDPGALGDRKRFLADVEPLATARHGLRPAPGVDAVLLLGERGRQTKARRRSAGIPRGTMGKLAALAGRFGVTQPQPTG